MNSECTVSIAVIGDDEGSTKALFCDSVVALPRQPAFRILNHTPARAVFSDTIGFGSTKTESIHNNKVTGMTARGEASHGLQMQAAPLGFWERRESPTSTWCICLKMFSPEEETARMNRKPTGSIIVVPKASVATICPSVFFESKPSQKGFSV